MSVLSAIIDHAKQRPSSGEGIETYLLNTIGRDISAELQALPSRPSSQSRVARLAAEACVIALQQIVKISPETAIVDIAAATWDSFSQPSGPSDMAALGHRLRNSIDQVMDSSNSNRSTALGSVISATGNMMRSLDPKITLSILYRSGCQAPRLKPIDNFPRSSQSQMVSGSLATILSSQPSTNTPALVL